MVEAELALAAALRLAQEVSVAADHREVCLPAEAMTADGRAAHLVLSEQATAHPMQEPAEVMAATEVSEVTVQATTRAV